MKITIFIGDLVDAPADALCTSTNPRLSLMMGTGGAVRARGGYEILRACEAIVAASGRASLPPGSAHVTSAGSLPCKRIIHCVASDDAHRSSEEIIQRCVRSALATADAEGCTTVAMPVFGSGHARVKLERALQAMADQLHSSKTSVERVFVVTRDGSHAGAARRAFPDASVEHSTIAEEEPVSLWNLE